MKKRITRTKERIILRGIDSWTETKTMADKLTELGFKVKTYPDEYYDKDGNGYSDGYKIVTFSPSTNVEKCRQELVNMGYW